VLADGREVLIAGEHEDYYDPDFFIYNDVVVKTTDGKIAIYGYPKDVFPPTDFHTATLLPGRIVLIGSLGYQEERLNKKETQVLQLMLDDFSIHKITTRGASPGWIHGHKAALSDDRHSISISGGMIVSGSADQSLKENIDDWTLDLRSWSWTRNTDRNWQQWTFRRRDHKPSQLFSLRLALRMRQVKWKSPMADEMQRLEASIGRAPDLDLIPSLYRPDSSVTELPSDKKRPNVFRVLVDGLVVRFTEETSGIRGMVEGRLSNEHLYALQESVRNKLSTLENTAWQIETL
jgi:hypothetical protein